MLKAIIFDIMCFFIAIVASYDVYITIYTGDVILEYELNPIAKYILSHYNGLAIFISLKTFGTFLVLYILKLLFFRLKKEKEAMTITVGVFLFQCFLSYMLFFYEN